MAKPELVRKDAMAEAQPTPGILRREAFRSDGIWAGVATTDPHMASGWHHHGDHTTYLYVASGRFLLESGVGGRDVLDASPGDFVKIPARAVHRESNPADEPGRTVLVRIGTGPVVVNVDGPDAEPG